MKAEVEGKPIVRLEMSMEEALWLKNYVQNNVSGTTESRKNLEMRKNFFDALHQLV